MDLISLSRNQRTANVRGITSLAVTLVDGIDLMTTRTAVVDRREDDEVDDFFFGTGGPEVSPTGWWGQVKGKWS